MTEWRIVCHSYVPINYERCVVSLVFGIHFFEAAAKKSVIERMEYICLFDLGHYDTYRMNVLLEDYNEWVIKQ